ncbi:MAG: fructose-bisphosphatase class III [Emergencia sp.]|jgi:fructose-1,6-bisphosphatase-3|uniref:Fructose-1,6-bisphosphatase class 3 n=1 Tax=Anaerotruncus colihominis TaxID=169435 RepID=A0A845QLA3_9FIRM|nr:MULTISPECIES: fructose-1,6-bisphosphatase [Clostridia]MCI9477309.1 fructose-bisphosphatase class III [Emergencia sp.]MCI9640567.1 fructose-bisphosphatase class III [Emergencia sp.]NBH62619.1 fructose-1,6-bisphosphatase [Anaerotruncus colihominis]NCF00246.1 fructose-1,6-bisphosphatase [Emergencia sp. 1XD21-10]NCF03274.1 fructose-1,6-bisphosphatase [Anaerotruncus sp. 80]
MPDIKFLELLSKDYPNIKAATAEIINLSAILALPKGTEYFLSDLHGEHEAFIHMLKSASGTIKTKIDEHYGGVLSDSDREDLAALIYNPQAELARRRKNEADFNKWCMTVLHRLVTICQSVSTKYTRSKVRRMLPKYLDYAMDELLHADDEENRLHYYNAIIKTIVESGIADDFIIEMADAISNLAVDHLHIIGDIFDRGAHPDTILDFLMDYHDVDFQWGNHDIVWMGAATGNWACIANILRMNISYNNFDMLEYGYGINLRPLASFAEKVYGDDPCQFFQPHILEKNEYDQIEEPLAAKMHKAIAICQFKVEGQRIKAHPEYHLENRLILDKINWENGTVEIDGTVYELRDTNFPTVDPENPYALTEEEEEMMNALEASVLNSEKLQKHIRFLYSHGALYKRVNGNLLYHGCIPMTEDGDFELVELNGEAFKGKALMDYLDSEVRNAYFSPDESGEVGRMGDLMWYLWLGGNSPLFGKAKMTTFERLFIADKAAHKEPTRPYYKLIKERGPCEKILMEFGLDPHRSKILNGHVPVKIKDGESPIKGGGLLYVIDGGISKAYQKQTGIAGYTFIFNSRFMALAQHKPYQPLQPDGTQEFQSPEVKTVEVLPERMMVIDTDQGRELTEQVENMKRLVEAYRKGILKERY